ncbi:MAG: hypothetical protein EOO56_08870 [Hymenobacter sp.]|nr:MAG: hypothetical protein EOO56_08870 [Hymenobacter sp.]
MVTVNFSHKLIRHLELYLWQANNFKLPASGYDLVLLLPVSPDIWSDKQTLLLSASSLFRQSRWDTTYGILKTLRASLNDEDYLSIFNVDIIEPDAYIVQQVKRYTANQFDGEINAPISLIGGVTNQSITAIKSTTLDKLKLNCSYSIRTLNNNFSGILQSIIPIGNNTVDVQLHFKIQKGEYDCLYSDIEQLNVYTDGLLTHFS